MHGVKNAYGFVLARIVEDRLRQDQGARFVADGDRGTKRWIVTHLDDRDPPTRTRFTRRQLPNMLPTASDAIDGPLAFSDTTEILIHDFVGTTNIRGTLVFRFW